MKSWRGLLLLDISLPEDPQQAIQVVNLVKKGYYLIDGILWFENSYVPDHIIYDKAAESMSEVLQETARILASCQLQEHIFRLVGS